MDEAAAKLKEPLTPKDLFDLARNLAMQGIVEEQEGEIIAIATGISAGLPYQIELMRILGFEDQINIVGFGATASLTENEKGAPIVAHFSQSGEEIDLATIITGFKSDSDDDFDSAEEVQLMPSDVTMQESDKEFRLFETNPFMEGALSTLTSINASSKEQAVKKYLDWCRLNKNFHAADMIHRGLYWFEPEV